MTLQQLEYIVALHRYGHFAKAAEHCGVTQPTLSSMIQKLEEELGVKIFSRKQQPIQPTREGQALILQAKQVLLSARHLRETAEEEKKTLRGPFVIGVLPTIAPYLVPRFLPQLLNKYPEMDLRVTEMKTEEIKKALAQGDLDAGILARIDGLEEMQLHTLFHEQFYAYVAQNEPLASRTTIRNADLKGQYLWLLDEGHCFRDQLMKFCELKSAARSKRAYKLGSIETFMRIVENDKGITFIPELALHQLTPTQRGLVRPFAIPVPTREIVLATAPHFIRRSLLDLLMNHIRNCIPQEMLQLRRTQQSV